VRWRVLHIFDSVAFVMIQVTFEAFTLLAKFLSMAGTEKETFLFIMNS